MTFSSKIFEKARGDVNWNVGEDWPCRKNGPFLHSHEKEDRFRWPQLAVGVSVVRT